MIERSDSSVAKTESGTRDQVRSLLFRSLRSTVLAMAKIPVNTPKPINTEIAILCRLFICIFRRKYIGRIAKVKSASRDTTPCRCVA